MKRFVFAVLGAGTLSVVALAISRSAKHHVLAVVGGAALLAAQTNAQAQLINGAGSSFDYPAFTKWFEAYSAVDSAVHFNYQPVGSGAGKQQLIKQIVDFGASDAPMSDENLAAAPGKILHIPVVAGGVALTYNLPGGPKLKLDSQVIAGIYLGTINNWNDPKIAALNPGVSLPDLAIVPVHRSDGSGTTFIFSDYLACVSPDWKKTVGSGMAVKWPGNSGLGAKGSEGVAGQVKQISGAIGYVELAYADNNKMSYADVKNSSGNFISPAPDSVSAALATAAIPADFRFSMVNAPGAKAYPIAGPSWVLIYQDQTNSPKTGKKLVAFLKWAVTDGQKLSPALDYAPLPAEVQRLELRLLDTIKY
jgi:phosphate transport system substrate-binding protein